MTLLFMGSFEFRGRQVKAIRENVKWRTRIRASRRLRSKGDDIPRVYEGQWDGSCDNTPP